MYKGEVSKFYPKNVNKYVGNVNDITSRSRLERRLMKYFDSKDFITHWASEEVIIPYICKTDNKKHDYHVDFWARTNANKEYLIEVKPFEFTQPPKEPKRKSKAYYETVRMFLKNQSKWEAAREYAELKGMKFKILTELQLAR